MGGVSVPRGPRGHCLARCGAFLPMAVVCSGPAVATKVDPLRMTLSRADYPEGYGPHTRCMGTKL